MGLFFNKIIAYKIDFNKINFMWDWFWLNAFYMGLILIKCILWGINFRYHFLTNFIYLLFYYIITVLCSFYQEWLIMCTPLCDPRNLNVNPESEEWTSHSGVPGQNDDVDKPIKHFQTKLLRFLHVTNELYWFDG